MEAGGEASQGARVAGVAEEQRLVALFVGRSPKDLDGAGAASEAEGRQIGVGSHEVDAFAREVPPREEPDEEVALRGAPSFRGVGGEIQILEAAVPPGVEEDAALREGGIVQLGQGHAVHPGPIALALDVHLEEVEFPSGAGEPREATLPVPHALAADEPVGLVEGGADDEPHAVAPFGIAAAQDQTGRVAVAAHGDAAVAEARGQDGHGVAEASFVAVLAVEDGPASHEAGPHAGDDLPGGIFFGRNGVGAEAELGPEGRLEQQRGDDDARSEARRQAVPSHVAPFPCALQVSAGGGRRAKGPREASRWILAMGLAAWPRGTAPPGKAHEAPDHAFFQGLRRSSYGIGPSREFFVRSPLDRPVGRCYNHSSPTVRSPLPGVIRQRESGSIPELPRSGERERKPQHGTGPPGPGSRGE